MNLKDLFGKSEDGVLSYDQFQEACKEAGIKLADLSTGDYVSKKKFDDELEALNSQITSLNDTISQRDTDLEGLKTQLTAAGTDAEKLAQLTNDFSGLQSKYDEDVKSYKAQLKKQAYEFAVKEFANTKQFTSNAAKRDFINSLIAKELKMEDGKILGADDFVASYSTDNADAFYVENNEPEPENDNNQQLPQFVNPTPGNNAPEEGGFHFNFTGVRSQD